MSRTFEAKPAVRAAVPVLLGLMGPSGSGKTFSALRVATGIQQVVGGDIYGIDTEANRMLHYANDFKFKHVKFDAPFGSLDYLAALQQCVAQGAKVVVVDSMSHEHEGAGGMIDFQEKEIERLTKGDFNKVNQYKMLAWQKPKAARRALINGLLQINANFVFCFRAKNTAKPVKNQQTGKMEVEAQGFMPIAGDEFVFEMTANCLLLPGAKGVPTWSSDWAGEKLMIKSAKQFDSIFAEQKPLDEKIGRALAEWARGDSTKTPAKQTTVLTLEEHASQLEAAAALGTTSLVKAWKSLPAAAQKALQAVKDEKYKPMAYEADEAARFERETAAANTSSELFQKGSEHP